jgi:pre-mRNA-splicing factor 18
MDLLKAEIAAKRKALQDDPVLNTRPTKYIRRGELERLRDEQERQEKERKLEESRKSAATATPKARLGLFSSATKD